MSKCWIGVASREHVLGGVAGGFCQVCHGKKGPLDRMSVDDWIVYYSPTEQFGGKIPCRRFTAIGTVTGSNAYSFRMHEDFVPWRRDISFLPAEEVSIEPLIESLSFIKDKQRWGFPFRRGCFNISQEDFAQIARGMLYHADPTTLARFGLERTDH